MATHGLPTWPWTDTATEDLPPPEALVLEGMRRWARAVRNDQAPQPTMTPPFVAEDVPEASVILDNLLRVANNERCLSIAEETHPTLEGDEAALVLACALAQRGSRPQALAAFCRLLPPLSAYAALGHAVLLGSRLRRAGWLMTPLPRH